MRVQLVILHAQAARGGAERYTRDLAFELVKRGHEVQTLATSFDADWPGDRREIAARGMTRVGKYEAFLEGVEAARDRAAVMHAMLPVLSADVYHPHAGIMGLRKRAGIAEMLNRRRARMGEVERGLVTGDHAALTMALSRYSLGQFREVYPTARAEVVLNGVDLARFDPAVVGRERVEVRARWGATEGEIVMLCVAQDFERKGVPVLVRVVAELRGLPLKLVVVGKDEPGAVVRLERELGVEERVVIPGAMGDVRPAYAGADLYVMPTRHDPCSLVTLEALACGVPVVSTVFNGSTEYMTDGVHGRVLPEVSVEGLAEAVRGMAEGAVRERAARACLELREKLNVRRHVERVEGIYEGLMRNR